MATRGRKRRKCAEPGCDYKDESPTGTGLARHMSRTHGVKLSAGANGAGFDKGAAKRAGVRVTRPRKLTVVERLQIIYPGGIPVESDEQLDFDLAVVDRIRQQ